MQKASIIFNQKIAGAQVHTCRSRITVGYSKKFQAKVLHLVRHIQYFKTSINLLVSFPDPPYDERTREYSTKFLNIAEFPWKQSHWSSESRANDVNYFTRKHVWKMSKTVASIGNLSASVLCLNARHLAPGTRLSVRTTTGRFCVGGRERCVLDISG